MAKKEVRDVRQTVVIVGIMVVAFAVLVAVDVATFYKAFIGDAEIGGTAEEAQTVFRHPLTGGIIDAPLAEPPQVFAVMIENSADAWPLSGLDGAFLVIEAPVEASIPRFEAFFAEDAVAEKIGPVRSARPYYLDWAKEFDAVYAHVGGSPEALSRIFALGVNDLNEFFQGEYFYRSTSRAMPHNAYTTMDKLRKSLDELALDAPEYDVWTFKDDSASGENKSLAIDWTSGSTYDVTWTYEAEGNRYERNEERLAANNVAVMETDIGVIPGDDKGRRRVRTLGEGRALVAQDGRIMYGTWKKPSAEERLRFFDGAGNEIAMNAGATWIEIVPSLSQATANE